MPTHKRYGPGNGKGKISLSDYHQSKDRSEEHTSELQSQ